MSLRKRFPKESLPIIDNVESGRLQRQSLHASVQAALAASSFVLVDQTLVYRRVNDRHGSFKSSLSLFNIARLNRQNDLLDEGTKTAAKGSVMCAMLFRLNSAFLSGSDVGQGSNLKN